MIFCQYIHFVFTNPKKWNFFENVTKNESFPEIEYLREDYRDFEAVHDST